MALARQNTPRLDIIENWVIDGIVNCLDVMGEAKYTAFLQPVSRTTKRHIAESLLITYDEFHSLNLTKPSYQAVNDINVAMSTISNNVYAEALEREKRIFERKKRSAAARKASITKKNNGHMRTWTGDVIITKGYRLVYRPNHPRARSGGRVPEHTLVAERMLGRPLVPGEVVHHIDFNKLNNNEDNLCVMTQLEHIAVHQETLKNLYASGFLRWDGKNYIPINQ